MNTSERRNQGGAGGHVSGFPHEYTGPSTPDGLPHGVRCVVVGKAKGVSGGKLIRLPNGKEFICGDGHIKRTEKNNG